MNLPKFNSNRKQQWIDSNKNMIMRVKEYRMVNMSYSKIAEKLDIGTMTAWRAAHV